MRALRPNGSLNQQALTPLGSRELLPESSLPIETRRLISDILTCQIYNGRRSDLCVACVLAIENILFLRVFVAISVQFLIFERLKLKWHVTCNPVLSLRL